MMIKRPEERRSHLSHALIKISFMVIVLSLASIAAVFTIFSNNQAREDLTNDLQVLANVLGNRSAAALVFGDQRTAKKNLESTTFRESIVKACLYDAGGELFASYVVRTDSIRCEQNTLVTAARTSQEANRLKVAAPVLDSGELIGFITIEASSERIRKTLLNALITTVIASAIVILVAYLVLRRLIASALRPLSALHDTALEISEDPYSTTRAKLVQNDEVGRLVTVFNTMLDNLDQENLALLDSEGRFRTLAESSPVGIYQLNAKDEFVYSNQKWHSLTRLPEDCTLGDFQRYVVGADQEMFASLWDKVKSTRSPQVIEYHFQVPDRDEKSIFLEHIAPIIKRSDDDQTVVEGYIGSLLDISDLKNAQMELENLAFYDPLTNLPNRRFFRDHLQYVIAAADSEESRVAILMLDLDNFKKINDTLGHDAGDELLSALAERLRGMVAQKDVVSRMGGDEFMILLKDVDVKSSIQRVADRILQSIKRPLRVREHDIEVTGSIGVATYPEDASTAEELMRNADLALYLSKESGRNRLSFFSRKLETLVNEKVYLERKLRQAIKNDELTFYVQPKWSLSENRLISGEVLVRWFDEEEGAISPGRFIPVAEEAGLILEMGDWLIDKVFESISQNRKQLEMLGIESLAINLSARQFFSNKLLQKIDSSLNIYDVDPSFIEFELTESAVMEDIELAVRIMERMKSMGCQISIDDFGTGYSSLSYLKRFPIDAVKIDQSFISDIPADQNDVEISSAIIAMGHNLGLEVVAEGVETQEQMDFLVEQGCDYAQGYLIARPMPFEQLFTDVPEVNIRMTSENSVQQDSAG